MSGNGLDLGHVISMLQQVITSQAELGVRVGGLANDLAGSKQELAVVKHDIAELRQDIVLIRKDLTVEQHLDLPPRRKAS